MDGHIKNRWYVWKVDRLRTGTTQEAKNVSSLLKLLPDKTTADVRARLSTSIFDPILLACSEDGIHINDVHLDIFYQLSNSSLEIFYWSWLHKNPLYPSSQHLLCARDSTLSREHSTQPIGFVITLSNSQNYNPLNTYLEYKYN